MHPTLDEKVNKEVIDSVSIPVMAKARIGHFVEAQMLESLGIDFIDESVSKWCQWSKQKIKINILPERS